MNQRAERAVQAWEAAIAARDAFYANNVANGVNAEVAERAVVAILEVERALWKVVQEVYEQEGLNNAEYVGEVA
jgi:hypothetical protein